MVNATPPVIKKRVANYVLIGVLMVCLFLDINYWIEDINLDYKESFL